MEDSTGRIIPVPCVDFKRLLWDDVPQEFSMPVYDICEDTEDEWFALGWRDAGVIDTLTKEHYHEYPSAWIEGFNKRKDSDLNLKREKEDAQKAPTSRDDRIKRRPF